MIGDQLTYHLSFKPVTTDVIKILKEQFHLKTRFCVAVGGESGSGKSSLAYAWLKDIEKETQLKGYLFHADDYFFLPPKTNHNKRVENIGNVGVKEVNLSLLDTHLSDFINGVENINKPLVNYAENTIGQETINSLDYDFCIVEGTYAMLLKAPIFKIFIANDFEATKERRIKRGRDLLNEFNEKVLAIEHDIVKQHKTYADLIINNDIER